MKQKEEFKPLDYVLVKFNCNKDWVLCQYSHTDNDGLIVLVGGDRVFDEKVIRYAGNEELLGTTSLI